jgi:hypothetical protein
VASTQEWPEARTDDRDTQERFRAYLVKLRPETGALGRFESFLSGSNLFSTGGAAFGASPQQPAKELPAQASAGAVSVPNTMPAADKTVDPKNVGPWDPKFSWQRSTPGS